MGDDIVKRLRASDADVCWGCGEWGCRAECACECHEEKRLIIDAAHEIERLRKRNNYLRQELSATDYRKRELSEEIDRLRSLITAWADACILMERTGSLDTTTPEGVAAGQALIALRKAVGR